MNYNIDFNIAALFIIITIMVHYSTKKNISTLQTRVFNVLITVLFIATTVNILIVNLYEYCLTIPRIVNYGMNMFYFLASNMLAPLYLYYICLIIKKKSDFSKSWKLIISVPAIIDIILIISTGITKWIFYIDRLSMYHQGVLMPILYVIASYYLVMCIVFVIKYYKSFVLASRIAVYFFTTAMLLAVILQMTLFKQTMIAEFAAAISLLMVYLSLEDPDDYSDKHLDIYNRNAFVKVVSYYIDNNDEFDILGIQIKGFKYINDTIGVKNGNILLEQVVQTLKDIFKDE